MASQLEPNDFSTFFNLNLLFNPLRNMFTEILSYCVLSSDELYAKDD